MFFPLKLLLGLRFRIGIQFLSPLPMTKGTPGIGTPLAKVTVRTILLFSPSAFFRAVKKAVRASLETRSLKIDKLL
jgi:hypothetical protein